MRFCSRDHRRTCAIGGPSHPQLSVTNQRLETRLADRMPIVFRPEARVAGSVCLPTNKVGNPAVDQRVGEECCRVVVPYSTSSCLPDGGQQARHRWVSTTTRVEGLKQSRMCLSGHAADDTPSESLSCWEILCLLPLAVCSASRLERPHACGRGVRQA